MTRFAWIVLLLITACGGQLDAVPGPPGAAGPAGPAGPQGPQGVPGGVPQPEPRVAMGVKGPACVGSSLSNIWGVIDFGINFPTVPVLVATLQDFNNQSLGLNALRARGVGTSRSTIRCDGDNTMVGDAVHWFA